QLSAFDRSGSEALKAPEVVVERQYRAAAVERAMKVQEVIMRAMAKQITWWQAAEILGVTPRTIRRMKRNWRRAGFDGLYDHRHHRPSPKRVPVKTLEKVLELYRDKYSDFNVRHFHEKLGRRTRYSLQLYLG